MLIAVFKDAIETFNYEIVTFVKTITKYEDWMQFAPPVIVENVEIDTLKASFRASLEIENELGGEFDKYIKQRVYEKFIDDLILKDYVVYTKSYRPVSFDFGIPVLEYRAYLDVIHPSKIKRRKYDEYSEKEILSAGWPHVI
jgi:hypothetical protein